MAYCTKTDIEKMIPATDVTALTDDEGTGAQVAARVSEAIAQADSEIDGYCGVRYSVPFSPVPAVIKKFSVDIAVYNLYSRRQEEIPETRSERYKNAIKFLEMLAKGTISLGIEPEPTATSNSYAETNKTTNDRIFTRDKLKGF